MINQAQYHALYQRSINDTEAFWAEQAKQFIQWEKPWEKVKVGDFENLQIAWFLGGKLNASVNCLDRHLAQRKNQLAIIWEGDEIEESRQLTYGELYEAVGRLANVLKKQGIQKGDSVCIYLPMIPEAVIAMLACARIGAVHSVVFAGFSAEALQTRILDAQAKLVITADAGKRGGKLVPIKDNVDAALVACPSVNTVIVVKHTGNKINWQSTRDYWYQAEIQTVSASCPPALMDANDPLFILYTSGSTGKPKGVVHATGGYLVHVATTFQYVFDYQPGEIFWCTADVGWITGHSYLVYGPLVNGATVVIFEGAPHYPTVSRWWEIIDRYQVNIFYTSPTAIRALRKEGEAAVKHSSRRSLRILGSVGEPINPDVWQWYFDVVGDGRCPIVDTWWQTETGGIMITPLPGATSLKPGSATWPFFGIQPALIDGRLVIQQPWPGLMQSIYGDHERFKTYFAEIPGNYLTGDGASCDADGYYWITGRNDDVIKVSGHRLGTEELESALLSHSAVSEAAVVAIPDPIKGQGIYAFVATKTGIQQTESLHNELVQHVRMTIGPIATIHTLHFVSDLPKTRSGKIVRRILRKIAVGEMQDLGDTSTLANPEVLKML